jgi:hypothetical protein
VLASHHSREIKTADLFDEIRLRLQAVEQSYSTTVDNMRDYNLKMIDIARVNTEGVFEFVR